MPKGIPAPGRRGRRACSLPPLKTVVVTGDLDPVVSFEVTGEAADAAAAQNLADVVRGFVALATLQANQKPELKQLASAVSVTTDANKVRIAARFPYELLDSLRPKKTAAAEPGEVTPSSQSGGAHRTSLFLRGRDTIRAHAANSPRNVRSSCPRRPWVSPCAPPTSSWCGLSARPAAEAPEGRAERQLGPLPGPDRRPGLRRGAAASSCTSRPVVLLDSASIVSVTPLSAIGPAAAAWSKLLAAPLTPAAEALEPGR